MYLKLFKNDIKNNFLQTCSIAFFILLSVAFLATAGHLGVQLHFGVNKLTQDAKTPHLLQMHKGELDFERMQKFVGENPEIEQYQILPFLNVENASLSFIQDIQNTSVYSNNDLNTHVSNFDTSSKSSFTTPNVSKELSLKDSVYDNGFSVQSSDFDFLLDLEGRLIQVRKGEIYVPLFYKTNGLAKIGDYLKITDQSKNILLKISGFVRDSQMNSSLSVSKRFIVHKDDFQMLKNSDLGELEYLIEFRLKDLKYSSKIEKAYVDAHLEANGPPMITYKLFQLVNSFSDGINIVILVLISFFMIGICLLCIRFTLLAKLEEDYKELVILKTIGLPLGEIRRLFLNKYLFISAISSIFGYFASFWIKIPLLNNMKDFFTNAKENIWSISISLLLSLSVFSIIFLSMRRTASQIKKIGVARSSLSESSLTKNTSYRKLYFTIIMVLILCIFIFILPMTMYFTLSDKDFVNYMGIGTYDIRIDISRIQDNKSEIMGLLKSLQSDNEIEKTQSFYSKWVDITLPSGEKQKIWMEFGNQETFPIKYIEGRAPLKKEEISLSKLNAQELSIKVGDELQLNTKGEGKNADTPRNVRVSGIFSDLTNGGKTSKTNLITNEGSLSEKNSNKVNSNKLLFDKDNIWLISAVKLKKGISSYAFIEKYQERFPFAKFADTKSYLNQVFGNTISMMKSTGIIAWLSSMVMIFFIILLFSKMIYLKEQSEIALLKALGFTSKELERTYNRKIALTILWGFVFGTLISLSLGDQAARIFLSLINIHGVQFVRNPYFTYIGVPLSMFVSAMTATKIGMRGIRNMNLSLVLKEDVG